MLGNCRDSIGEGIPVGIQDLFKRFGSREVIRIERDISENTFRGMRERWLVRFEGGAQVILRTDEGELVLVRQEIPWEERVMWTFPGGGVTKGESFIDCVVREAKEEIGLDIEVTGVHCIFQNIGKSPDGEYVKWYLVVFEGEISFGQMKVQSPEIQQVGSFKELPRNLWLREYYQDLAS